MEYYAAETKGLHMANNIETSTGDKIEELQVKIAEADLALKMAELRSKTSFVGLARSPAAIIAVVAFLLPLWLGILNSRDQQEIEVRKFESDLITKAIYQSRNELEMRDNIHNLLKLGLIKEQQAAVCRLLQMKNVPETDTSLCPATN
jgi:hypothetical protein